MYELLTKRYGFYWTCSIDKNGGTSLVERTIQELEATNDVAVVNRAVDRLLMIFAVLFLAWREINPAGTALDWLVFQTTNVSLNDVLLSNERGNIDRAVRHSRGAAQVQGVQRERRGRVGGDAAQDADGPHCCRGRRGAGSGQFAGCFRFVAAGRAKPRSAVAVGEAFAELQRRWCCVVAGGHEFVAAPRQ
jgi:hypothetical protein